MSDSENKIKFLLVRNFLFNLNFKQNYSLRQLFMIKIFASNICLNRGENIDYKISLIIHSISENKQKLLD